MFSMRPAHLGLLSFFGILTISGVTVFTHSLRPTVAAALAIGEPVPAFALPDPAGEVHELDTPRVYYRVIVYIPDGALTDVQQKGLGNLVSSLAQDVPVNVVAVTNKASHDTTVMDVCPIASTLLVDERRTIWQVTGENAHEASVCVVGPLGRVRLRSKLPPDGPITLADIQQSEEVGSDRAIAAVIAQVGGRH